ncbi:HipA family kinase [Vibrio brasiliensis]
MSEISIDEIVRKMRQGLTEPYLCKADDKNTYVVKSSNATYAGLVKEWVVAHLGKQFGLPVPSFKVAWLDDSLVQYNDYNIESGYCFASHYHPNIQEITFNQIEGLDRDLLKDLFMFDYWVKNNDRNLTQHGGNANFFFDQSTQEPFVLDHNLAFSNDFDLNAHINQHVGSASWNGLDLVDREHYEKKFENALGVVNNAINTIPQDWLERYSKEKIDSEIVAVLDKYKDDDFWEGIKK